MWNDVAFFRLEQVQCWQYSLPCILGIVAALTRQFAYAPMRQQKGGAEREGNGNFFATRNIQKFCELC